MNFTDRIDKWLKALEGMRLEPLPQQPTLARDYPAALNTLQRRRHRMKYADCAMFIALVSMAILRILDVTHVMAPAMIKVFALASLVLLTLGIGARYAATIFKCPRCGSNFFQPGVGGIETEMSNPNSRCQGCNIEIGELSD